MSRTNRSRKPDRPTGLRPGTELSTLAAADQFDAAMNQAARANAVDYRVPAGHIQTIVPGANYAAKPNTAESAARRHAAKQGVDPALNRRFETATEAREFRKRESVDTMSLEEFNSEIAGKGSARRREVPGSMQDVSENTNVQGYNPNAFKRGAEVMRQMGAKL